MVVAVLLIAMSCALLVACGGVEGTYKFSEMTYGGQTYKVGDKMGEVELTEDSFVFTLEEGGVLKVSEMGETVEGTWEKTDDGYALTINGDTQVVQISGGKLTSKYGNSEIVLKK